MSVVGCFRGSGKGMQEDTHLLLATGSELIGKNGLSFLSRPRDVAMEADR
jgi:hypothetical protein